MIKVLFMIHDLGQGGAEKVLVNLVNHMDSSKLDITVISLFGGGVNEQFLNRNIRYKTIFPKAFPGNSRVMKLFSPTLLHRLFVRDKYDIEIAYLEGPATRIVGGCPERNTKLITWVHCTMNTSTDVSKGFRNFREALQIYNRFEKRIFVSEGVKKSFQNLCGEKKGDLVLYNTNDSEKVLEFAAETDNGKIFNSQGIRLIAAGKIMPVKGFDRLARIHKLLRDEGYPVHTYILGEGPEQPKIEEYLRKSQVEDSYTFLGYQTNPYKYVAKCDLFVCASIAEGFSTATTEALIVGTPVVTTLVSGMKEMLGEHNEYGIVTENNEEALYQGIKKLLDDSALLEHYREKAKERGKFFSTENTVRAVEEMLDDCYKIKGANTNVLLLTGTIKPFVEIKNNNTEERLKQYREVIRRYITESDFDSIVFAENSGYLFDTDEFSELALKHGKIFEYLNLSSNVDKRNMSTGEAVLMREAFRKSHVLSNAEVVWKSTGRVYIRNVNKLLRNKRNQKENAFLYSKQYNSIQTWFFRAKVSDLKRYFLTDATIENMSKSCIEYAWMECYQENKEHIRIIPFNAYPDAVGTRSSGASYGSSGLKIVLRNMLLKMGYFTVR